MSDQPWRNPRPAPTLPEVQPKLASSLIPSWLRSWWPALLWAGWIFFMSTDLFSADHTSRIIEPLLRWLFPHFTHHQIVHIHHIIRKCAHFTEYFIFSVLLFRAVRGVRIGWHWTWGITALIIAAGYACLDEIHQSFVASRTASPWDSLLDSVGAFFAYLALFTYFHLRNTSPPPSPNSDLTI